jgi:hypothetical protein
MESASERFLEAVMETVPNAEIELTHDPIIEEDFGNIYGKYIGTFFSSRGQVRADLFDRVNDVVAYVCFPTGLYAGNVEDSYYNELQAYARSHGFADRFRLLYVE